MDDFTEKYDLKTSDKERIEEIIERVVTVFIICLIFYVII